MNDIILSDYQEKAVYKIMYEGIDNHGLLLWWMMGTGKTLAGVALMLNCPNKKVSIICPKELTFIWKNEIKKVNNIYNDINFYDYDTFLERKTFENEIVIVDEAHHIITDVIDKHSNSGNIIKLFNTSHKILLLTGTPIYTDFTNLIYLINIAAGKEVIPYNAEEFKNKYYKIHKSRSLIKGYYAEIADLINKVTGTILMICTIIGMFLYIFDDNKIVSLFEWYNIKKEDYDEYEKFKESPTNEKEYLMYKISKVFMFININKNKDKYAVGDGGADMWKKACENTGEIYKGDDRSLYFMSDKGTVKEFERLEFRQKIIKSLPLIIGTLVIFVGVLMRLLISYKIDDYKYLDTYLLAKDISEYAYYYKNEKTASVNMFPRSVRHVISVPYSNYQMSNWLNLTQNSLDIKMVKKLGIKTEKDVKYHTDKIKEEEYLTNGVYIGNLSDNQDFSPKFYEILKISKNKRAVFYSNSLESGIFLFRKFLDHNKIKYEYLDIGVSADQKNKILETFKNSTIFLLLHPIYSEGVTILGTQQIHLLEPFTNTSKKEQVIARVVRYMSHVHLPESQRHVDIYQWYCENNTLFSKAKKFIMSVRSWFNLNKEVFYTEKYNKFSQDSTPDSLVLSKESLFLTDTNNLSKQLEKLNKIKPNCCIVFPTEKQNNGCIKKLGHRCSIKKPSRRSKNKSKFEKSRRKSKKSRKSRRKLNKSS